MSRGRLWEQLNTLENSCGRIWKICQKKQCSTKMQQSKHYVTETDLEAGGEQEKFLGWPFGHLVDGLRHWLMWAEMRLVLYFPCTDAHRDKYPLCGLTSSVWKVKLEKCWKRQLEWFPDAKRPSDSKHKLYHEILVILKLFLFGEANRCSVCRFNQPWIGNMGGNCLCSEHSQSCFLLLSIEWSITAICMSFT